MPKPPKIKNKDLLTITAEQWAATIIYWFNGKKATQDQITGLIECIDKAREDYPNV